jgi:hypothetical protein
MTGRKTKKVSRVKSAIASGLTIGKTLTVAVAGPRLGAEQTEQEWRDVWELTGCEWTACTVPMANTSAMHKTHSARAIWLLFAVVRIMASRLLESNAELDERPVTLEAEGPKPCAHLIWPDRKFPAWFSVRPPQSLARSK